MSESEALTDLEKDLRVAFHKYKTVNLNYYGKSQNKRETLKLIYQNWQKLSILDKLSYKEDKSEFSMYSSGHNSNQYRFVMYDHAFHCKTCFPNPEKGHETYICPKCAKKYHKGHDLMYLGKVAFKCDNIEPYKKPENFITEFQNNYLSRKLESNISNKPAKGWFPKENYNISSRQLPNDEDIKQNNDVPPLIFFPTKRRFFHPKKINFLPFPNQPNAESLKMDFIKLRTPFIDQQTINNNNEKKDNQNIEKSTTKTQIKPYNHSGGIYFLDNSEEFSQFINNSLAQFKGQFYCLVKCQAFCVYFKTSLSKVLILQFLNTILYNGQHLRYWRIYEDEDNDIVFQTSFNKPSNKIKKHKYGKQQPGITKIYKLQIIRSPEEEEARMNKEKEKLIKEILEFQEKLK